MDIFSPKPHVSQFCKAFQETGVKIRRVANFFWLNIASYAARFDATASVFLVTSLDSARSLTSQLKKQNPNCQMPEAGSYFPSACGGLTMIQTSWIVSQAAINTLASWNLCFLLGTTDVTFCSLFGSAHL